MTNEKPNMQLGKYEVLEKIGEGGFGTVYKAHDPSLDRYVALKVLHPYLTKDTSTLERFRLEARLAARLKHPHIVTIFEVDESQGNYYIAMEYVEGQSLSALIEAQGPLSSKRIAGIIRQVGEALDYAHTQGLIHRDVKPSNIILGEGDRATLTDFGIVKAAGESGITTTGVAVGTPEYMAPEQVTGEALDARTDTYSLGVVAYHALTGKAPFTGTTPYAIQKGHAEEQPQDPRQLNPALGEPTAEVLLKALAKEPEARYQSGEALAAALAEAAEREEEQYWNEVYEEASTLMAKREFERALEKWALLAKARPDFRDVAEQQAKAQQQIELEERYTLIVKAINDTKIEAKAILEIDNTFPDTEYIFQQLDIERIQYLGDPSTKSVNKDEVSVDSLSGREGKGSDRAVYYWGTLAFLGGVILLLGSLSFFLYRNDGGMVLIIVGALMLTFGIWAAISKPKLKFF